MTEKEILEALERQAFLLEQKLDKKVLSIKEFDDELPEGIVITLTDLETIMPTYFSDKSLKMLDLSTEEYFTNPTKFVEKLSFPGDFERATKLVVNHLSGSEQHLPINFIQRLKMYGKQEFEGIYTLSKKIAYNNNLVNIGIRMNGFGKLTLKMLRAIEETDYVRKNYHKFASLTTREREIITLLALGYQNNEIGDQLFISKATVEQHRKNLKRKLEIKRFVDLIRFAQAFDMI